MRHGQVKDMWKHEGETWKTEFRTAGGALPTGEPHGLVLIHDACSGQYVEQWADDSCRCYGCGLIVPSDMKDVAILLGAHFPNHNRPLPDLNDWKDYLRSEEVRSHVS